MTVQALIDALEAHIATMSSTMSDSGGEDDVIRGYTQACDEMLRLLKTMKAFCGTDPGKE